MQKIVERMKQRTVANLTSKPASTPPLRVDVASSIQHEHVKNAAEVHGRHDLCPLDTNSPTALYWLTMQMITFCHL